tara:strand:+ start:1612 stop:3165 length:1554 start_codon:yes stop_codon:yes gene_type:complete
MDLYWVLKKVSNTGILVDKVQRYNFKKKLSFELNVKNNELNELIPEEVLGYAEYSRTPKNLKCKNCKGRGYLKRGDPNFNRENKNDKCRGCKGTGAKVGSGTKSNSGVGRIPRQTELLPGYVQGGDGYYYVRSIEDEGRFNWGFKWNFSAKSTQQVQKYIRFKDYPLPRHSKTRRITTGQKELEALYKEVKDPVIEKILEVRAISDLLAKYADNLWWEPAEDGRIHPRFNFNPSTGRLASEKPNIQNPIKRGTWGKEFRNQFIASPGMLLVGIDFNAIEAVLTGWFAKDQNFIEASKLSIHAILSSYYLQKLNKWDEPISLDWNEAKLKESIRHIKKHYPNEYSKSKSIVYLSLYGGGPKMIFNQSPGVFNSVQECRKLQTMFFETLAIKIKRWQKDTLKLAHRQCYLENPFGHRHYFWDVLTYNGKYGSQAKDALAELPQSTASSIYKDVMVRLRPELVDYLRAPIHDELLFELPINEKDDLIEEIKSEMEKPIPELDGLTIEVEASTGEKWGEMS